MVSQTFAAQNSMLETLLAFSAGSSNKSDTTVSMQLSSVLEPPCGIEIGRNCPRANLTGARELTRRLDDVSYAKTRMKAKTFESLVFEIEASSLKTEY